MRLTNAAEGFRSRSIGKDGDVLQRMYTLGVINGKSSGYWKDQDKLQRISWVRYVQTLNPKVFFQKEIIGMRLDISFKNNNVPSGLSSGLAIYPSAEETAGERGPLRWRA